MANPLTPETSGSAFACPHCLHGYSSVRDSRPARTGIRRRRLCLGCGGRFTTHEHVTPQDITVIKRDGRRQPFDREKLARSIHTALAKLPVDPAVVEVALGAIVRGCEMMADPLLHTASIGEMVCRRLRVLHPVAYVRYASVYREFGTAGDFLRVLEEAR